MPVLAKRWTGTAWAATLPPKVMMDAVMRNAVSEIAKVGPWMAANNATVVVGEIQWADGNHWTLNNGVWSYTTDSTERAQWQAVAEAWMAACDDLGIDWQITPADKRTGVLEGPGGVPSNGVYRFGTAGEPPVAGVQAGVCERYYSGGMRRGVDFSSPAANSGTLNNRYPSPLPSNGQPFSNLNRGTAGVDYWWPSDTDLEFLAARGVPLVNIQTRWERLQPTLGAALDATHLAELQAVIAKANSVGIRVAVRAAWGTGNFLDFGSGITTYQLTRSGVLSWALFADFWGRMATALDGSVFAFDLINEPRLSPTGETTGAELCTNGDYDATITGWTGGTLAYSTAKKHSGAGSMLVTSTGNPTLVTGPPFGVTPGTAYAASCYSLAYANYGTNYNAATIRWYNAGGTNFASVSSSGSQQSPTFWMPHTSAGVAPAGAVTGRPCFFVRQPAGQQVYVDDFSIKACVPGTYVDGDGNSNGAQQAAVDAIRAVDGTTEIWAATPQGSGIAGLLAHTAWITDPADKTVYNVHHYWDGAGGYSGLYNQTFADELAFQTARGY